MIEMFKEAILLGMHSVTPVHAGSGSELSVIDLPIQRERYTKFPIIWGQSLKGALRGEYVSKDESEMYLDIIFGLEKDAQEHAAAISVGDAKVLLFPVRSLKGVFAYVTCPMVLERLSEDLELARKSDKTAIKNIKLDEIKRKLNNAIGGGIVNNTSSSLIIDDKKIVLEDILLEAKPDGLSMLIEVIEQFAPLSKEKLNEKLVIVSDDLFTAFVTMTTEIVARTKIDAGTGTVKHGALWYEEYLPSDTLLYSVIAIGKPRITAKDDESKILQSLNAKDMDEAVDKIADKLTATFNDSFLQIGGDETVGKGFVKVRVFDKFNKGVKRNDRSP
jgi:CRISPR-associated protein Cmr4